MARFGLGDAWRWVREGVARVRDLFRASPEPIAAVEAAPEPLPETRIEPAPQVEVPAPSPEPLSSPAPLVPDGDAIPTGTVAMERSAAPEVDMLKRQPMSLKAKIEAVIYASEEPVTLAQLMGLLGQEAQSELDRMESRQESLALDGFEAEPVVVAEPEEPEPVAPAEPAEEPAPEAEASPDAEAAPEAAAAEASAAEKRAAKEKKEQTREQERVLREYFREMLGQLVTEYSTSERGIEIREVAGGYRMATKPEYHDAVRGFVKSLKPPLKLTLQALETLAVVAYKQPITAPEVSEIRGVDSSGVLGSLMTRKLVTTAGRKQVIGRPILYKTTKDFLLRFGLKDIAELPSIEEFEKLAGEFADAEPVQKEIPMAETEREEKEQELQAADVEEEREATEPQADGDSTPVSEAVVRDAEGVDGRISGPPPNYSAVDEAEDSPARDAEIQADEARDEGL